ncbi:hypothetical protein CD110_03880 [Staphylococcus casei]|uniref:hypothetical protein n=1 Tax=Staphylococcus casei TaxID=201828 RepID=UPI000CD2CBC1|nr:hypothetical protein [Staphylococcus casei]PNZ60918.1 hypothetical protein CD110_03880 [Staphylococcus casei]WJE87407.1 hypothetical protein QMO72_05560 [Staphylococcus casei]
MINYEMALYEIEMYKKAHESLSENLTHANKMAQQYKTERDTLIDDLSWYKAKVSRLEDGIKTLERKNANARTLNWELKGYADMYKEDSDKYKSLLSEISQHIGNKPSSSTYKYFRAKLDGIGIKEGE